MDAGKFLYIPDILYRIVLLSEKPKHENIFIFIQPYFNIRDYIMRIQRQFERKYELVLLYKEGVGRNPLRVSPSVQVKT